MAKMIPIKYDQSAMKTEKRLFDIFRKGLSSKHYCLSELYLQNSRADFVIVGPQTGIIVFEVKDWLFSTIICKKNNQFILQKTETSDRFAVDDPFNQLQKYKRDIFGIFMKHNISIPKEVDGRHGENYKFGVREGLVLGGITKEAFYHGLTDDNKPLAECFSRRNIIFKDDLEAIENGSRELLDVIKEELLIPYIGNIDLSTSWVENIKKAFYQDRIIRKSLHGDINFIQMDEDQGIASNVLANSNLLIRGSAGSGKTIVLMKRAIILASEVVEKKGKILYTYYNKAIGKKIQSEFNEIQSEFNEIQLQESVEFLHIDAVMARLKRNPNIIKYDYILVDEAQDIKKEDLMNLNKFLKNEKEDNVEGKLTLCSDGGQNIYSRKSFSYSELELELEVLELKTVYRCTTQIHQIAIEPLFNKKYSANLTDEKMMVDYSVQDNDYIRNGKAVNFIELGKKRLSNCVRDEIFKLFDSGIMPHEIAIVCLYNSTIVELSESTSELSFCKLDENYRLNVESDDICISTVNSIKGYEFRNIILCNFENKTVVEKEQFPRKFYVALTRAIVECTVIVSSKDHEIVHELSKKIIEAAIVEADEVVDLIELNDQLTKRIEEMNRAYLRLEGERNKAISKNMELIILNNTLTKKQIPVKNRKSSFKIIGVVIAIVLIMAIINQTKNMILPLIENMFNGDVASANILELDKNSSKTTLYQLNLLQSSYVDYMFDGKNGYKLEDGKFMDGTYEDGTIISIVKDLEEYYFLVKGTKNYMNEKIEINNKTLIKNGRFAIGLSSNDAQERYSADGAYMPIDESLLNRKGVYFTYLYTNRISGDEVLGVVHKKMTQ